MKINRISMSGLTVSDPAPNLRRDLHAFVGYMRERRVKRSVRSNDIPKADAKRIAKLMSTPEALEQVNSYGTSAWVNGVDWLAYELRFVRYDVKGEYAGYSSHSPLSLIPMLTKRR